MHFAQPSLRQLWGPAFPDRIFTIEYGDWLLISDRDEVTLFAKGDEHMRWHWDSCSRVHTNLPFLVTDYRKLVISLVGGAVLICTEDAPVYIVPLLLDPLATKIQQAPPGILPNDAPFVPAREVLRQAAAVHVLPPQGSDMHPPLISARGLELYLLRI